MKKHLHRANTRGVADHGWLKSFHTFSFSSYHHPQRMNFGKLRVLNDDDVAPGMGFDKHPHNNMEIVSIPLSGALRHQDSTGRDKIIHTNDVQIMSAGSGIYHSEQNASKTEKVKFLQLWILPKALDIEPRYEQKTFDPADRINKIQTIVSPKDKNAVWINQDATFSLVSLEAGKSVKYAVHSPGNGVYIFVIVGSISLENETLATRDAIGIEGIEDTTLTAENPAEVLIIEVPLT